MQSVSEGARVTGSAAEIPPFLEGPSRPIPGLVHDQRSRVRRRSVIFQKRQIDLCKAAAGFVQKGSIYENLTGRLVLKRAANLVARRRPIRLETGKAGVGQRAVNRKDREGLE